VAIFSSTESVFESDTRDPDPSQYAEADRREVNPPIEVKRDPLPLQEQAGPASSARWAPSFGFAATSLTRCATLGGVKRNTCIDSRTWDSNLRVTSRHVVCELVVDERGVVM
jgi:hypothetical protein